MKLHIFIRRLPLGKTGEKNLRQYTDRRFDIFNRLFTRLEREGEILIKVEISQDTRHRHRGKIYYAEATARLPRKTLRALERSENAESAIDGLRDKMKKEYAKYKDTHLLKKTKKIKKSTLSRKGRNNTI